MSKGKDDLGDRMKMYEMAEAGQRFLPLLPVLARLDGRAFSSWTRGLERPFDKRMTDLMVSVTQALVAESGALIGYTQSDEISLVFYSPTIKSQIFFDGRKHKMISGLTSIAVGSFVTGVPFYIPEKQMLKANIDCRVWQVPNLVEAANTILWREIDATKNSVSMAAREFYSHAELLDKGRADMMDMMMAKGKNWNDYPVFFKRGTYVQRQRNVRAFTAEEIDLLPEKHEARTNPDLRIERSEVKVVNMPPFIKVINRTEVIFYGADPITEVGWEDANTSE
jgi:tRNA(His) guanylyltransferase